MGYELTIYVDRYPAIEYDHPYFHTIIKLWKEENDIKEDKKIFTKKEIIEFRDWLYQYYIRTNKEESGFDYDYEGDRILELIKDLSVTLETFPSIQSYKILFC